VEKNPYRLCEEVLRRLRDAGVLDGLVVIGSWCVLFYEAYFQSRDYAPTIRTRDLDLAVPIPPRFPQNVDVTSLLKELGFVIDFRGSEGYIRFLHPDLILEFLVPERGRPASKPFDIPALGINAQPLRYLDLLLAHIVTVTFRGIEVHLPHPANFSLHKLIVAGRRHSEKADRDRDQAILVMGALSDHGEEEQLRQAYAGLPGKWQRAVRNGLHDRAEADLLTILKR